MSNCPKIFCSNLDTSTIRYETESINKMYFNSVAQQIICSSSFSSFQFKFSLILFTFFLFEKQKTFSCLPLRFIHNSQIDPITATTVFDLVSVLLTVNYISSLKKPTKILENVSLQVVLRWKMTQVFAFPYLNLLKSEQSNCIYKIDTSFVESVN